MRVAVIGSRELFVENLGDFLPENTCEIISGGARGIDSAAAKYARENGIKLTEFLPQYKKYKKSAPLRRNITIIQNCDLVLAFWDGQSRGTKFVINKCRELGVKIIIFLRETEEWRTLQTLGDTD